MRIKTFQGRSLEEVLPQIRAELGPEAVVVGQRQKVQGGVAGFFGTKVIEVTAADQMPSDDVLVGLEAQLMGDDEPAPDQGDDDGGRELAERFAGAMHMGRRGGLDVVDDWDPADDAELAEEYGRVLQHAATSGFAELEVPTVMPGTPAAAPTTPPTAQALPAAGQAPVDPMAQAMELARRTHAQVRNATERVEQAATGGTYAPPRALPRTAEQQAAAIRTFGATVEEGGDGGYEPEAVPSHSAAATTVDHALRTDLAMPRSGDQQLAEALGAAMDVIDLSEINALRNVVSATRRTHESTAQQDRSRDLLRQLDLELQPITSHLLDVGVDQDVVDLVVDCAVRHRLPFGGSQDVAEVIRSVVEETIDVRTGFPPLDRAHRAAFVGPAHGGRTSVVAKVAARYANTGMRVGILSIVRAEPGVPVMAERAFDQLDAAVRYAADPGQAMDAVEAFAGLDVILVDTPGATYLDPTTFAHVESCLLAIGVDDVHVVLPLATSGREARSIADTFRTMGANRLVVSRVDESRFIGQVLNFGFRLGLPMTYLSEGPRVPEDLRAVSAREVADRILRTDRHS